jgi:hypothetical protein
MWGQDVDAVICRAPREQDTEEASKIKLTMAKDDLDSTILDGKSTRTLMCMSCV